MIVTSRFFYKNIVFGATCTIFLKLYCSKQKAVFYSGYFHIHLSWSYKT